MGLPDLNLVRAFVAIYETRSVTLAADRLGLTQPSLSHALARLRQAYDDRLFVRSAEGLVATSLARQLYERLGQALAMIDATLESRLGFDAQASTRRFRLAMSDIGALYFTGPLLARLQQSAPRIEIEIVPIGDTIGQDLALGQLDVAIGNLPALMGSTSTARLFEEHYVCLMSATHPDIGERMSVQQLATGRHIMVSSPSSGHNLIDQALAQQGVSRNIAVRIPHFTVLPQLLAQSNLLVILPSRVAQHYVAQGALKALKLPVKIAPFDVRLHWHPGREAVPAHQWLVDEAVGALGAL